MSNPRAVDGATDDVPGVIDPDCASYGQSRTGLDEALQADPVCVIRRPNETLRWILRTGASHLVTVVQSAHLYRTRSAGVKNGNSRAIGLNQSFG